MKKGMIGALTAVLANNLKNVNDVFNPQNHSRRNRALKTERLYSAVVPKDASDMRVFASGAVYSVSSNGAWRRINHPKNKRQR